MKAMIFAAGLGSRLYPLTKKKPKALVEVNGKTLLERTIAKLAAAGFHQIIINIHHFADQIRTFIEEKDFPGIHIEFSDERDLLLDTGGGLKKAAWFFNDQHPFLACNVDIISDIDLKSLMDYHHTSQGLATLAVRHRQTSRYLLFDKDNRLRGWRNKKTGDEIIPQIAKGNLFELAFSGIQIIDPGLFAYFPREEVFSLINLYIPKCNDLIFKGYIHDESYWFDLGTPEKVKKAEAWLNR